MKKESVFKIFTLQKKVFKEEDQHIDRSVGQQECVGYLKLVSIKRVSSARAWTLARPNSSMKKKRAKRDCCHSFVAWLYTPSISDFSLYQSLSINTYIHQYSTRSGEETAVWVYRERKSFY